MDLLKELSNCPLFKGISEVYLNLLLTEDYVKRIHVKSGEVIFHQGDEGRGLYIILSGKVEVELQRDNNSIKIATLEKESFFGEISLLIQVARTATIKALEDCCLFYYDNSLFQKDIEDNNMNALRIGYNISINLAKRLAQTNHLIVQNVYNKHVQSELSTYRNRLASEILL